MKSIKVVKVILFIMIMAVISSSFSESSKRALRNKKLKNVKIENKGNRRKKKNKRLKKSNSVIAMGKITEKDIEVAYNKSNMAYDPRVIYTEGNNIILMEQGDKESENTIKVGNYFLEIPKSMDIELAKEIISKMSLFVKIAINAGINEQFNLGAIAIVKDDSDYRDVSRENTNKVKEAIIESDLYKAIYSDTIVKDFIVRAIMLELGSVLDIKEEKGFFAKIKSKFRFKTVAEEIFDFAENNVILNEIELFKELKELSEDGLSSKVIYLLTSAAYHIKKGKEFFINFNNKLFEDMIHAITIPLGAKFEKMDKDDGMKINFKEHKQMKDLYKSVLKLFNASVSGIKESKSAIFVLESTAYYTLMKTLKYGSGLVALGAGLHAGYRGAQYAKDKYNKKDGAVKGFGERISEDYKDAKNKITEGAYFLNAKLRRTKALEEAPPVNKNEKEEASLVDKIEQKVNENEKEEASLVDKIQQKVNENKKEEISPV